MFVCIKIPGAPLSAEKLAEYKNTLNESLRAANVGEVFSDSSLTRTSPSTSADGSEIDVEVTHLEDALNLLRNELWCMGMPDGTQMFYIDNGEEFQEGLTNAGWALFDAESAIR